MQNALNFTNLQLYQLFCFEFDLNISYETNIKRINSIYNLTIDQNEKLLNFWNEKNIKKDLEYK